MKMAGLGALAWLVATGIHKGERGAAAGLAGVLVGGLTQDVLGDLEVARATWTWLAVGLWTAIPPGSPVGGETAANRGQEPSETS